MFRLQDKKAYRKKVGYEPNKESVCDSCGTIYTQTRFDNKTCGKKECMRKHSLKVGREYKREMYKNNFDKIAASNKKHYNNNTDKIKIKVKEYYLKNKDKVKLQKKQYRMNNSFKISERQKLYRIQNISIYKMKDKIRYESNKENIKIKSAKYYESNKEKIKNRIKIYAKKNREKINKYLHDKNETDMNFRLSKILRGRLRDALQGKTKKNVSAIKLLGCDIDTLKNQLELQFEEGMNWDNYGFYGWHIDHINPCANFNLADEQEQKKCFHHSNLQPLWAKDNLSKGKKVTI